MAWIDIQISDLQDRLAGAEFTAVQTVALNAGQANPITSLIQEVCEEVRGYVANAVRNLPLAEGISIPSKLKSSAISMIVFRMCTRLPTKVFFTDERKEMNRAAVHLLERVSQSLFAVDRPDPQQMDKVEVIGSIYMSIRGRHKRFSERDERGI
jgi:uncharacterized protein DUF1320